jgi:hypothetical protein
MPDKCERQNIAYLLQIKLVALHNTHISEDSDMYLDPQRVQPFKLPRQENATRRGMTHAITPNNRLAKVCKRKRDISNHNNTKPLQSYLLVPYIHILFSKRAHNPLTTN